MAYINETADGLECYHSKVELVYLSGGKDVHHKMNHNISILMKDGDRKDMCIENNSPLPTEETIKELLNSAEEYLQTM